MDAKWQGSVEINALVERVYAYLSDFPKHCEWAQTLSSMEQKEAGDAAGVGAVYLTHELQALQSDRAPRGALPDKGFKGKTMCTVTELAPNKRIAWEAKPSPVGMGIHAELAFDLESIGPEQTKLTQSIAMHQPWLPLQIFSRVAFKMKPEQMEEKAAGQWQASLNNIKAIMEE